MSRCGYIEECEPGVFLAIITADNQHYALKNGAMVPDETGSWINMEESTFGGHKAFSSLEAAKEWVAADFERSGLECWPWEPGYHAGTWRAWPSNVEAEA